MAHVSITVNARKYEIACDDGQEAHLRRLAEYVDKRVEELVAAVGQIGDTRLMLMASLLLADELSDAYTANPGGGDENAPPPRDADALAALYAAEDQAAAAIGDLAERIEAIADKIERL
ncbi:MAG: cell division protein ZapA [Rhodospirillales bacterium]|nr:cell division protein ZapA [Rhodospirillales bacterium]MCW8861943.1 cell division protein ZapA [Rhodospirillales bacterium]MCW8952856.1 cell division protein ZapA [Rhodospirillales bacterium]MCW8970343.1 cell division protein ZapA [Rhodospirillales bacterium]MCW9003076.1 cell division protein ZapA [Rhodospirillales bacterium]